MAVSNAVEWSLGFKDILDQLFLILSDLMDHLILAFPELAGVLVLLSHQLYLFFICEHFSNQPCASAEETADNPQ